MEIRKKKKIYILHNISKFYLCAWYNYLGDNKKPIPKYNIKKFNLAKVHVLSTKSYWREVYLCNFYFCAHFI